MKKCGKASSKVILIGEHAVVYGKRGISLALDKGVSVCIGRQENGGGLIIHYNGELVEDRTGIDYRFVESLAFDLSVDVEGLLIEIETDIPMGVGLGGSASFAVALIRAFIQYFEIILSKEEIFRLAGRLEGLAHGNPSGIDHATVLLGGPLLFQKKNGDLVWEGVAEIENRDILKNCFLVNTGKPLESTKDMVEFVASRYKGEARFLTRIFDELDSLVDEVYEGLKNGDEEFFKKSINKAGLLLEDLGVVSDFSQDISKKLREKGAGVKISGAGGRQDKSGILFVYGEEGVVKKVYEDVGGSCLRV